MGKAIAHRERAIEAVKRVVVETFISTEVLKLYKIGEWV